MEVSFLLLSFRKCDSLILLICCKSRRNLLHRNPSTLSAHSSKSSQPPDFRISCPSVTSQKLSQCFHSWLCHAAGLRIADELLLLGNCLCCMRTKMSKDNSGPQHPHVQGCCWCLSHNCSI